MRKDFITGITGLAGAAFFAIMTATSVRQVPNLLEPGPRMMPFLACFIIAICSIGLMVTNLKNKNIIEKPYFPKNGVRKIAFAYLLLVSYGIALHIIGFVISTPFAMVAFIFLLKGDKKVKPFVAIIISVLVTTVLYFMFVKGFRIKLPSGILL